ncbi:hypothetical protein [Butyrivibrio sp. AE3003]|uniref:hypothetical protein n=1 Tax=Butyrivibrio sp. AE3003 TaxID=1496721 RepID=UPI000B11F80D|nr:hypothetical protein [Butyrivibrio sp. AE3003]
MINNNSDEMNMVPLENISFPEAFFRPEVRNGFLYLYDDEALLGGTASDVGRY